MPPEPPPEVSPDVPPEVPVEVPVESAQSKNLWGPQTEDPIRLAVLISGGGTTMVNLAQKIRLGQLRAQIVTVISSNAQALGLQRAAEHGLPSVVIGRRESSDTGTFSKAVFEQIRQSGAELVCLAGFLSLLEIPDDFVGRVINIHPALLPAFGGEGMYGRHVHEAVLAAGCKVSGCTVHLCDQAYDTGPIVVQRACAVLEDDSPETLAKRVFEEECLAYPEAVGLMAEGRVTVVGGRTQIWPRLPGGLVERAKMFCEIAHRGQERDDGQPYATHPIAVAQTLIRQGVTDAEVLAGAYLHDVLEDTPVTAFQLRRAFGREVVEIVEQLTHLKVPGEPFEEKHARLAQEARQMSERARMIKLADRLDNLSKMCRPWSAHKQNRYARVTVDLLEALRPWPLPAVAAEIQEKIQPYLEGPPET